MKRAPAGVQAPLRFPGDLTDARILALLAAGELETDGGGVPVVVRGLDQEPAGMSRAGLGDPALPALVVRGPLAGDDPR